MVARVAFEGVGAAWVACDLAVLRLQSQKRDVLQEPRPILQAA